MKNRIILSLLLSVASVAAWAVTAKDILSFHYTGETLQCAFTEVKTMPRAKKEIAKSGNLTYTNPGNLRLDYTDPQGDYTLIADQLFEIQRNGRVQRFNISNPEQRMAIFRMSLLFAFAGDVEALAALNNATVQYKEQGSTYVCTVTADHYGARGIASLLLTYSKTTGALQSLVITENNGNYTTYQVKK